MDLCLTMGQINADAPGRLTLHTSRCHKVYGLSDWCLTHQTGTHHMLCMWAWHQDTVWRSPAFKTNMHVFELNFPPDRENAASTEVHTVLFLRPHPNSHRLMRTLPVMKLGLHFTYKEERICLCLRISLPLCLKKKTVSCLTHLSIDIHLFHKKEFERGRGRKRDRQREWETDR